MNSQIYQEFGWQDDTPQSYHSLLLPSLRKILPKDGSPILDVGCGNGFLANTLLDEGYNMYGIDASEQGIEIANHKHSGHFFVNDISLNTLPKALSHIPFGTIISTEVIEHLYNPRTYITFIRNILELHKGGTFIVSTPYHGYLKNIILALFNRMDYHYSALWVGGHIKFWSRTTLTKLLLDEGFHDITFLGVGRIHYLWNHMIMTAKFKSE
ncbi:MULTISPECIES: class I SAM-dependent methyltransferase [Butyricimonas]|uniref:class I SAM-dependent methyltransferase n=1 Tax=Butyricimonas TaxID=574697 RepID=UPI001D096957|nr:MULTISPECIES: class I SAM-dependent methyltransferase [Butyricimonas]MCB6972387.1 class I SAM-dependent methyltransferase [Butyricimonas synergistica]MCG4519395.1 class I SAM-dependent methyltransferase [Butyricimonas sp. DFI.6.44]